MTLSILDAGIIGGGFIGLAGVFFPKFLFMYTHQTGEKVYDKKESLKYRFGGFIIFAAAVAFYVYDNYFH